MKRTAHHDGLMSILHCARYGRLYYHVKNLHNFFILFIYLLLFFIPKHFANRLILEKQINYELPQGNLLLQEFHEKWFRSDHSQLQLGHLHVGSCLGLRLSSGGRELSRVYNKRRTINKAKKTDPMSLCTKLAILGEARSPPLHSHCQGPILSRRLGRRNSLGSLESAGLTYGMLLALELIFP